MAQDLLELVDETACRRFEADWFAGRRRPLEDYLPPPDVSHFTPTLEELVHIELELEWEEAASQVSSDSADAPTFRAPVHLENYLARFPQLRREDVLLRLVRQEYGVRRRCGQTPTFQEYRTRFPHLPLSEAALDTKLLSHCREHTRVSGFAPAADADVLEEPRSFGDYQLLEVIGRGGMGVVYRARQIGAGRDVALKVIRSTATDGLSPEEYHSVAERFHTEAVAAARLAHDNIVTVYDVGEHEGRCYYAMRLVEGQSLAELARGGPLENRRAAQYLKGAARAIHAAHTQGVLHRDVKPANILIDGQTDRALVADFGLAKLLQDTHSVTRSGELIGTPAYMAPEQIDNAAAAGPESDVYSLGATLYHLLTGRPPFQAVSLTDTLWQVKQQEPVAPWLLNWGVDRDLETICLKCLQKERSKRYTSAGELADDLQRFLNGEPILARPVGKVEKLRRWARRNPAAARGALIASIAVVLAVVAVIAGYSSTIIALKESRRNAKHAQNTVNQFYTEVSESDLLNQPGMQPLRKKLLSRALDYYEIFLEEQAGDRKVARDHAAAAFRAGRIVEELESPGQALSYFDRARDAQQKLLAANPSHLGDIAALADTLNARGAALRKLQRLDESMADFKQSAELRERLTRRAPNELEYQRKLANSYMNLGIVAGAKSDFAAARRYAAQGQTIRNRLLKRAADSQLLRDSGKEHYNLGNMALAQNRPLDAVGELEAAVSIFRELSEANHADLRLRMQLVSCYRLLARALLIAGNEQTIVAGIAAYDEALKLMESLAQENPSVNDYQVELAGVHRDRAAFRQATRQWDEALESLDAARRILEPLATVEPRYRRDFAVVLREIGCVQLDCQKLDSARENLTKALRHLQELVEAHPADQDYQIDLLEAERLIGLLNSASP